MIQQQTPVQEIHLLISKDEFLTDELIPNAADSERVNAAIRKAQDLDLRPVLGHALYYELISQYDPDVSGGPDEIYQTLMEGEEYVNSNNETILFPGLRMALKYWASARFLNRQQATVTTHSVVTKKEANSEPVDPDVVGMLVREARSAAVSYWNDAKAYLDTKKDVYTLWKYNSNVPRAGFRIHSVGGND